MGEFPVIDANGHITESTEQLRPHFEGRHGERGHWAGRRSYYPEDGWDRSLGGQLGSKASDAKTWLAVMDEGGMEAAILYPTAGRRPDRAAMGEAVAQASYEEMNPAEHSRNGLFHSQALRCAQFL